MNQSAATSFKRPQSQTRSYQGSWIMLLSLLFLIMFDFPEVYAAQQPNIVFILADDLGYGDVNCFNPAGKIKTPHMDRLAAQGMSFTQSHSSSAVCTPTRYGILTGRYNWRSSLQTGVLGGYSRRLIEPNRMTVAAFLKKQGYSTACFGKWHLGMDMPLKGGGYAKNYGDQWKVDYTGVIVNGPLSVGFDRYYGISASLDMPPYVFIENDRFTGVPTVEKTWIRKGPATKEFEAVDVLPTLARKAIGFINESAPEARKGHPFFLYLPLASPHTPIVPGPSWEGKSQLSPYGDFVMQTDDAIGQVLNALDTAGLGKDTLVILTSDNGCAPMADIEGMIKKGHYPSGPFRGHKADIFEGGHHLPFIVRWTGQVQPGSTSEQLVCHNDFFRTVASILDVPLPDDCAEDSISFLPTLRNKPSSANRTNLIHHSVNGSFAIQQDGWKLILTPDSGGWSDPRPGKYRPGSLPTSQLYNLKKDVAEKQNAQAENQSIVKDLTALLEKYVTEGRSTPGKPQKNTVPVKIRK